MGKASDIAERLSQLPPEDRGPKKPELRLKPDLEVEISDNETLNRTVQILGAGEVRNVLVKVLEGQAVLVPVERYVDLVGTELATDPNKLATTHGLVPDGLESSEVEPVDPEARWD